MIVDTIKKVTSTTGSLPPVLLDLTQDTVSEENLSKDETAHNREGYPITGQMAIEDAEAWAVGTKEGIPVAETDIQYQNNSKYYANLSGSIMQIAGQQALAAATSANNAHESELAAADSEAISGSYMRVAGEYKDEAAASADRAMDSEAYAVGTRGGIPVPPTDHTYHNNSKYWSDQAKLYGTGGVHYIASVAFANIPISGMAIGDMYNIEDDFITDSRFQEGAGIRVKAGANIIYNVYGKWDVEATGGANVLGVKGNAEATYREGNVNITPANIGYFSCSTLSIGGTVPPVEAGETKEKFLKNDGKWHELPIFQGASGSIASVSGLLPQAQEAGKFFRSDGNWVNLNDTAELQTINGSISRIGGEIENLSDSVGNITELDTTAKDSAVAAINEVKAETTAIAKNIEAVVNVYGSKNLLPNNAVTEVKSGITYTVNNDGSVTANGTSNDTDALIIYNGTALPVQGCILSGFPTGSSSTTYGMGVIFEDNTEGRYYENTILPKNVKRITLIVFNGNNISNRTFYPMIRDTRITDPTYVPYAMTNRELTKWTEDKVAFLRKSNNTGETESNPLAQDGTGIVFEIVNSTGLIGRLVLRPKGYTINDKPVGMEIFDKNWSSVAMFGRI